MREGVSLSSASTKPICACVKKKQVREEEKKIKSDLGNYVPREQEHILKKQK